MTRRTRRDHLLRRPWNGLRPSGVALNSVRPPQSKAAQRRPRRPRSHVDDKDLHILSRVLAPAICYTQAHPVLLTRPLNQTSINVIGCRVEQEPQPWPSATLAISGPESDAQSDYRSDQRPNRTQHLKHIRCRIRHDQSVEPNADGTHSNALFASDASFVENSLLPEPGARRPRAGPRRPSVFYTASRGVGSRCTYASARSCCAVRQAVASAGPRSPSSARWSAIDRVLGPRHA
jgi:hypothetical protein